MAIAPGELEIQQWANYEGEDWWAWAVWIEGREEALDAVGLVEWTLHPSFPHPVRERRERANKFRLETGGWGGFPILARVQMKDGEQMKLHHQLTLFYPVSSVRKP